MKSLLLLLVLISCATKKEKGFDKELTGFSYPYSVSSFSLETQKQKLHMAYMDIAASDSNGKVAVLLHGKNFSGFYWKETIEFLHKAGYRVIVPDQVGFGKSSKPSSYQFSFQVLAENTHKLLESLKVSKATVIGHSMGGMLATRYALMYPNQVENLILVNPIGLEDYKILAPYKNLETLYELELKATPDSIREYQKNAYYAGEWKDEYEALITALKGWTEHSDFPRVAWNNALTAEMIYTQPVVYEFQKISSPTLLIMGERDRTAIGKGWVSKEEAAKMGLYPELGRKTHKLIKGSKLVEIPGVGHLPQVENFPAYKDAILMFLRN